MLDHASITVDHLDAANLSTTPCSGALGHARVYRTDTAAGYGVRNSAQDRSHTYLSIMAPPSVVPDDRRWAFRAGSRTVVEHFYAAALASSGRDDGGVAARSEYHASYYSAFVLDPGGNRLEAVCHCDPPVC